MSTRLLIMINQSGDRMTHVQRWDVFEWVLTGPEAGNPFLDVNLNAQFRQGDRMIEVTGFYDGNGTYRIRFMPDSPGIWQGVSSSNKPDLTGQSCSFVCTDAEGDNHGPVIRDGRFGLRYADGSPYCCLGTTCYAWIHQGDEMAETTLKSLESSPFDKVRMTVFPKSYRYNEHNDPEHFVFPVIRRGRTTKDGNYDSRGGQSESAFDYDHFDLTFFAMLEKRIRQLMAIGVEADVILFHPYDRWGFSRMPQEVDHRYLRYTLARLSVYRNVWWSLANEFDFMPAKTWDDWEAIGQLINRNDPYQRLTGIHNGSKWFDHTRPWITHCSIQTSKFDFSLWREKYGKPMVIDEMCYEGNVSESWGNICAREMVHRFWEVAVQGGYPGHSEVYLTPEHVMWWNKGSKLRGESPTRVAFLRKIVAGGPDMTISACPDLIRGLVCGQRGDSWIIGYTGVGQPIEIFAKLPVGKRYNVRHIDTWNMQVVSAPDIVNADKNPVKIPLTGKPYMAFLLEDAGES